MANHISNGTFETLVATVSGTEPDGWAKTQGSPDLQTDGNFEWANFGYFPSDLDASTGSGYLTLFSGFGNEEGVETTLNTQVDSGESYTLTFDYYVSDTDFDSLQQSGATELEITVGGQIFYVSLDSTGQTAPYWQTISVEFTATDTTTYFAINTTPDSGAFGGGTGIALDNFVLDKTVVPCFVAGTLIETPSGEKQVEDLRVGDWVLTHNGDPSQIIWTGKSDLSADQLTSSSRPVRLKPGSIGNRTVLLVSPQHCFLLRNEKDNEEVLVRAKHLAEETKLASFMNKEKAVSYVHLLLDQHAMLLSGGIPSESFYPGNYVVGALSKRTRSSLMDALPRLNSCCPELTYGQRFARVLKRREVRDLHRTGVLQPVYCELAS